MYHIVVQASDEVEVFGGCLGIFPPWVQRWPLFAQPILLMRVGVAQRVAYGGRLQVGQTAEHLTLGLGLRKHCPRLWLGKPPTSSATTCLSNDAGA